jgi:hypothetical protein
MKMSAMITAPTARVNGTSTGCLLSVLWEDFRTVASHPVYSAG